MTGAAHPAAPAIPLRLAGRPLAAGLAVPWVSVHHADGTPVFGRVDSFRQQLCLLRRLCQACGQPLLSPLVLFARARDIAAGYVAEPGLHPECAAYSAAACPMLAGAMRHYRSAPRPPRQERCGDQRCACRSWTPAADSAYRAGHAAEAFAAIWITLAGYRVKTAPGGGEAVGIDLEEVPVLKVRPVPPRAATGPAGPRGRPGQER